MDEWYLVETSAGPDWDPNRPRREQAGWAGHGAFMDALAAAGTIVLGGPIGELDGDRAVLVIAADSDQAARAVLAGDPWAEGVLIVASVRRWTVWLRSSAFG